MCNVYSIYKKRFLSLFFFFSKKDKRCVRPRRVKISININLIVPFTGNKRKQNIFLKSSRTQCILILPLSYNFAIYFIMRTHSTIYFITRSIRALERRLNSQRRCPVFEEKLEATKFNFPNPYIPNCIGEMFIKYFLHAFKRYSNDRTIPLPEHKICSLLYKLFPLRPNMSTNPTNGQMLAISKTRLT